MACCCQPSPSCNYAEITVDGLFSLPRSVSYSTFFGDRTFPIYRSPVDQFSHGVAVTIPATLPQPTIYQGSDVVNLQANRVYRFRCISGVWTMRFQLFNSSRRWEPFAQPPQYLNYDQVTYIGEVIIPTDLENLPTAGTYNLSLAPGLITSCARAAGVSWLGIAAGACPNGLSIEMPDTSITIGVL